MRNLVRRSLVERNEKDGVGRFRNPSLARRSFAKKRGSPPLVHVRLTKKPPLEGRFFALRFKHEQFMR